MLSPLVANASAPSRTYRPVISRSSSYIVASATADLSTATWGLQHVADAAIQALKMPKNQSVSYGTDGVALPAEDVPCADVHLLYPFRNIFCGTSLTLVDGTLVQVDAAASCICERQFIRHIIQLPHLSYVSGIADPTSCGKGFAATISDTLQLACTPCPSGTFLDQPGLSQCQPCAPGTVSNNGAMTCTLPPSSFPAAALIAPLVVVTVIAIVLGALHAKKVIGRSLRHAPTSVPFGLLVLKIHQADEIATRPCAYEAFGIFMEILHRVIEMSDGYLSETVIDEASQEEMYIITTKEPSDAVLIAIEIVRAMHTADWPREVLCTTNDGVLYNGLMPCMFMQCVTSSATEISRRSLCSLDYVYRGHEIKLAKDFCLRAARPGQILASAMTLRHLREFPATFRVFGEGVECPLYSRSFVLDNYPAIPLFSIVPAELAKKRIFIFANDAGSTAGAAEATRTAAATRRTDLPADEAEEEPSVEISAQTVARVIDLTLSRYDSRVAAEHLRSIASVWGVNTGMSSARLQLEISNNIARAIADRGHRSTEQGSRALGSSFSTRVSRGFPVPRNQNDIGDPDQSFVIASPPCAVEPSALMPNPSNEVVGERTA